MSNEVFEFELNNYQTPVPFEGYVKDSADDALFVPAKYSHDDAEKVTYSDYSYWKSTLKVFFNNRVAVILLIVIFLVCIFSIIQPYLPNQFSAEVSAHLKDTSRWKESPSWEHWFGTDATGRDMWSRVWAGTRISLALAFIVAVAEVGIGVIIGALWGYVRKMDVFMTEIYNIFNNIPTLIIFMLMSYIVNPSFMSIAIIMVAVNWIYMARYIRNMVVIIRDREYNLASRSLGTSVPKMLMKNIVPFLISVIIMRLALSIPSTISYEVILTYLGVGLPATMPSLGNLVNTGQGSFMTYPYLLICPALIVSIITVSFYVVGNVFSDASDPRNHM